MKKSKIIPAILAVLPVIAIMTGTAHAAGILDSVTNDFKSLEPSWFNALSTDARQIFSILVVIEIAWFGLSSLLASRGFEEIVPGLLRKVMVIGLFYAILINANTWITDIINGFQTAGATAAGVSALSPSTIVSYGVAAALRILNGGQMTVAHSGGWFSFLNIGSDIGRMAGFFVELVERVILAVMIFLSFFLIALEMLILLIESYLIIGAGVLFLGFGGSRWTARYVNSYINYAISIGTKLFVIYLIVGGLYMTVIPEINAQLNSISTHLNVGAVLTTAVTAMAAALLAKKIPEHAGALLGGASNLTAGAFGAEVGRAAMIGGTAAAAVATGGAAVLASGATAAAAGAATSAGAGVASAAGAGGVAASSGASGVAAPAVAGAAGSAAPGGGAGVSAPKPGAEPSSSGSVGSTQTAPQPAASEPKKMSNGRPIANPDAYDSDEDGAQYADQPQSASAGSSTTSSPTSGISVPPGPGNIGSPGTPTAKPSPSTGGAAQTGSGSTGSTPGDTSLPENNPAPGGPTTPGAAQSGQAAPAQKMSMSERFARNMRVAQGMSNMIGKAAGGHGSTSGVSASHANFSHGNDV